MLAVAVSVAAIILLQMAYHKDEGDDDSEDDYANEFDADVDEYFKRDFKNRAARGIEVIFL